ncbi:MAG: Gfo/Idh/MocA family oxidoreductase [Phycisphaeraceae bacterium]
MLAHSESIVRTWTGIFVMAAAVVLGGFSGVARAEEETAFVRVGVIGLDTSHAPAFAKLLNDENAADDLAGFRVVAANPKGSTNLQQSVERQPGYTEQFEEMGIAITGSIDELLEQVDVVLLLTNDGHPRLEQALKVLQAGKPLFMDKPAAASLTDLIAIYMAAEKYNVPLFTSSSLRYAENAGAIAAGEHGEVLGADTWSPASTEPTHPDLFWYMIHGVEPLFTVMGTGCVSVTRTHTEGQDVVVGVWDDGRIGTVRGMRSMSPGYGGTILTSEGTLDLGGYNGYRPLVVDIVRMFRSGEPSVSAEESIEIYAFMQAADVSKAEGGKPVSIASVMEKARARATARLAELDGE